MTKPLHQQRRGKGSPAYRAPSHRNLGMIRLPKSNSIGVVVDIAHCVGHSAPIAVCKFGEELALVPAVKDLAVGDALSPGSQSRGSYDELGNMPDGTQICCIELRPGDGGKIVRTAGSSGFLVSKEGEWATLRLPSGKLKRVSKRCRAIIGAIAGMGVKDKPFVKAGKKYHATRARNRFWPIVKATRMASIDHPFGGGRHKHAGGPTTVSHNAPPGAKVGSIAARRMGRKK